MPQLPKRGVCNLLLSRAWQSAAALRCVSCMYWALQACTGVVHWCSAVLTLVLLLSFFFWGRRASTLGALGMAIPHQAAHELGD